MTNLILGVSFLILLLSGCNFDKDEKPLISIVSPENGYLIYKGDSVEIIANANDPDGLIETVDFFIDDRLVSSSKIAPYKYVWNTKDEKRGKHRVSVMAIDNDGLSSKVEVILEVQTILPEVRTLPISFIGTTLLTSGGEVTSLGIPLIHSRGVCWNKMGNPTLADSYIKIDGEAGTFVANLTDLELGSKYFVRAFVENVDTIIFANEYVGTTADTYYSELGTFIDTRDSNQYDWVKIGNQIWMAENLRYATPHYQSYINYEDSVKYGLLYSFNRAQNACPSGWHLPLESEWMELINYLGGPDKAGAHLKEAGYINWVEPNSGATNNSMFSALPGGYFYYLRYHTYGFALINKTANFWGKYFFSSETTSPSSMKVTLDYNSTRVSFLKDYSLNQTYSLSVRCIKDSSD